MAEDLFGAILGLADALEASNGRVTPPIGRLAEDLASGVVGRAGSLDCHYRASEDDVENVPDDVRLELHYLACLENLLTDISEQGLRHVEIDIHERWQEVVRELRQTVDGLRNLRKDQQPSEEGSARAPHGATAAQQAQRVRVVCLNRQVADALRRGGLDVVSPLDRAIFDFAPAVYVHAPEVVIKEPYNYLGPIQFKRLKARFDEALEQAGAPPPAEQEIRHDLRMSITHGLVLPVVFIEEVLVDRRLHEFEKAKRGASPIPFVTQPPRLEYAGEVVDGILPVSRARPVGFLFTPSDLSMEVRQAENAPEWCRALKPMLASQVHMRVHERATRTTMGPMFLEEVRQIYFVHEGRIEIVPLFVNGLAEMVGLAVRLGSGAVLALPECRSAEAKASLIRLLTTDLWEPIQEWLRSETGVAAGNRASLTTPQPQEPPLPEKVVTECGDDVAAQLATLEEETPPLDKESDEWVRSDEAARLESVETRTLADYRYVGIKNEEGTLGRDTYRQVWRRVGTKFSRPWYLKSTLRSQQGGAGDT